MTLRYRGLQAWAALLCCVLGFVLLTVDALAQSNHSSPPPPEELSYLDLEEALVRLHNATGLDFRYNPALLTGKRTGRLNPKGDTPEHLLRAILQGTGLYFYQLSTGAYAIQEVDRASAPRGSLAGYVIDKETGEPLLNATVRLLNAFGQGTATNAIGGFGFATLPPDEYLILVTHVAYQSQIDTVQVWPGEHTDLYLELQPTVVPLLPITVEDFKDIDQPQGRSPSLTDAPLSPVNGLGTADLTDYIGIELSGVNPRDGTADVHIQGGDPGEHQFRLDGVPVFEPVHLNGLLGLSSFAIKRITVYKAGFSAAQGSQLAGVISAEHALTSPDGRTVDVQVDPLSLNARMHLQAGRTDGLQAQLMAAVRQSIWHEAIRPNHIDSLLLDWNIPDDFLLKAPLLGLQERAPFEEVDSRLGSLPPPQVPDLGFTDLHVAGRLRVNRNHAFHASYYRSKSRLKTRRLITAFDSTAQDLPDPDRYRWGNDNAQIRYTGILNPDMLLSARLRSSRYNLEHTYAAFADSVSLFPIGTIELYVPLDLTPADDGNRIREVALESTLDYVHRYGHTLLGLEVARTAHRFRIQDILSRSIVQADTSWRAVFVAEHEASLSPRMTVKGGIRLTYLGARQTVYTEPRLEVRYVVPGTPLGTWSFRGAAGLYRQFLNQFDKSSISPSALFPSIRFWMPVDETIAPPTAYHVAADVLLKPGDRWTLHLESYYKHQPRLLQIDYPALWLRITDEALTEVPALSAQADFLRSSRGYAYGSAFSIEHTGRRLRTLVRYEYNVARRQYAFSDSAHVEPVPWSEPHRLVVAFDWTPHPRLIATARWRSGWGRMWAYRRAYYDFLGSNASQVATYGDVDFRRPTAHKLSPFHQLDLGTAYTHRFGPTALQIRLDVLNVLNQENVADRTLRDIPDGNDVTFVPENRLLLSRSFSAAVRFIW
ncbi:MAG: carboxypeptidase regulatory-like domain-containing protein [Rhodothermales bacterium]